MLFLLFPHIRAAAKFSEASDHEVPDLIELWVATDQEHVSCDTVRQHLFASDPVVAQSEEDPAHVGLNLSITNHAQRVEQVHNSLFDQDVDGLLRKSKVNECQS